MTMAQNMSVTKSADGNSLIVTIDISKKARDAAQPSSTGKTLVVATSNGYAQYEGINVSLNATLRNPAYTAPAK